MAVSGNLITRDYTNFRGVDFSNKEVALYRSPDALNVWKDYRNNIGKMIETRPSTELLETFSEPVYGLFFYRVNTQEHLVVHSGTKLYDISGGLKNEIYTGLAPVRGTFFVYNNILYYKENTKYIQFDGSTCSNVVGYVPTTSISRTPTGGGAIYEDVNILSDFRKNEFVGDGESTEYHLDSIDIDEVTQVSVNGTVLSSEDYEVNSEAGVVTFDEAPPIPDTEGQSNVVITFAKEVEGYKDRILKCSLATTFDNRVFFSGNPTFPNVVWHSSLNDPTYISDLDYYNEGLDLAAVKALVPGNECLWVFKEPSQANTTVFYHEPSIDSSYGKIYPSAHSSISTGCVATGINFNDDILFFSNRGLEAIGSSITGDKVLDHRSSLVDSKLLSESNYESLQLAEWEGYLLVIIGNKVYLADSRAMFTNEDHNEYEWFYWELGITPTCAMVKDDVLYLGSSTGIYTLTNYGTRTLNSYWTTPYDEFNYPQYQKTTNKKGSVIDMEGEEITVSVRTDNNNFELINTYTNVKGYVVCRIKRKKWKAIQLKLASNKPFGVYETTLESYVGSYVKR
jgi:hypothetical protein